MCMVLVDSFQAELDTVINVGVSTTACNADMTTLGKKKKKKKKTLLFPHDSRTRSYERYES